MDDEAVATAIATLNTKMDNILTAINEMKNNCVRQEGDKDEKITDLYNRMNAQALTVQTHDTTLKTHNRYFGYVASILIGIVIALAGLLFGKVL